MHALITVKTGLGTASTRAIRITLVAGIVMTGTLVPVTAHATDESATGHGRGVTLTSDEGYAIEAEQIRQQEAAKVERATATVLTPEEEYGQVMEQMRQQAIVKKCTEADITMDRHGADVFPSCEFTPLDDTSAETARGLTQERQSRDIADAYARDGVYTLYDAESVLASNMPEATTQAVLGMIAPRIFLAMQYGHNGVYV